ncbi:SH3 domain-containing protein Dlish-like [Mizuhopecten yessoensis]|uniref:GRB2-related adapter protein n=1 Tax=Mizuhopecten yessoensis TaxID=6573 RepID=A0A210Q2N1_MIZYE|nr:SH3 domain-containing protein Dlish-like [Mizuhopecten yessoensis]OWF42996.1 GRB2-related adapter protein [Mizuhopecten yessoensis]
MAFLCPSRVGRKTKVRTPKKKDKPFVDLPGRITGSDSIDTLQRVGLEKDSGLSPKSKVRVITDFQPCVDEEVAVKRGDEVYLLYKENDWAYVIKRNGEEGFIPYLYCTRLFGPESISSDISNRTAAHCDFSYQESDSFSTDEWALVSPKQDSEPKQNDPTTQRGIITREEMIRILQPPPPVTEENNKPDVRPFRKTSHGQFIALFDFSALDENDTNVERAELVDVLNIEDPDWSWIRRYDGCEGFVPKSYICPVEPLKAIEKAANGGHSRQSSTTGRMSASSSTSGLGPAPKIHQRTSNNMRTGHPYRSQPVLNVTANAKWSSKITNVNLSETYVSSDAVNSNRGTTSYQQGTLSNVMANAGYSFSDSTSTLPPPTTHVISISPPTRSISQLLTQNVQRETSLPSTFKPQRKQSATDSDFDDPACASSLPGTPIARAEASHHSQTDAMKYDQQVKVSKRFGPVSPRPVTNTYMSNSPNQSTDKKITQNSHLNAAPKPIDSKKDSIYANVPFLPKQADEDRERYFAVDDKVNECVLLYDYTARSQDDLTVRRGDSVYDDGRSRGNAHWVWVFSPRTKAYGYVPRQYIKQVVQTSL